MKLIANNNRFLILPGWHIRNLASRTIALCLKRIGDDWMEFFGHRLVLVETFVDPEFFSGTVYKASNWLLVGRTRGFARKKNGYAETVGTSKLVFVKPLVKKKFCLEVWRVPFDKTFRKYMTDTIKSSPKTARRRSKNAEAGISQAASN